MYSQFLWKFDLNWPVFSEYIVQDGYVLPAPDASFELVNALDLYNANDPKPVHTRLANLLWTKNQVTRIDENDLLKFVHEFGLLGLGRRFNTVKRDKVLGRMTVLPYSGHNASLEEQPVYNQTPWEKQDGETNYGVWNDITPQGPTAGQDYFRLFFPHSDVYEIEANEAAFWRHYGEPIGTLLQPDLRGTDITGSFADSSPTSSQENSGGDGRQHDELLGRHFSDTLAHHVTDFATSVRMAVGDPEWYPPSETGDDSPDGTKRDKLWDLRMKSWHLDRLPELRFFLKGHRVLGDDGYRWELGIDVRSLLDACYLMLLLDLSYGRRLGICPWCNQVFRLGSRVSSNRRFCNEGRETNSGEKCSLQYHKLKSYQKKVWNAFLRTKYSTIENIEVAWGQRNLQDQSVPWTDRGAGAVKHPTDLRDGQTLSPRAKSDYRMWRSGLRETKRSKNDQVLDSDYILRASLKTPRSYV